MLKFVWRSGFDRMSPRGNHTRKIIRVHGVRRAPLLQLLKGFAKVVEDLPVDVLDFTFGRHDGNKAGNSIDNLAKTFVSRVIHCTGLIGMTHSYESYRKTTTPALYAVGELSLTKLRE